MTAPWIKTPETTIEPDVTEYGVDCFVETSYERGEQAATIQSSNGAWLSHMSGEAWNDLTSIEQFDAFSNLKEAKRTVRSWVEESGEYVAPFRWIESRPRYWVLEATIARRRRFFDDGSPVDTDPEEDE